VKKPAGSASRSAIVKPVPVSSPSVPFSPVVKGPVKHPTDVRLVSVPTGFGNASRGGPDAPNTAACMCVAVLAGDW
jgi:hypothetical protein